MVFIEAGIFQKLIFGIYLAFGIILTLNPTPGGRSGDLVASASPGESPA